MAIVKGLEPGAILFKYQYMGEKFVMNHETRRHEKQLVLIYATVELYTRHARTNGAYIDPTNRFLIPFLKVLGVKVMEYGFNRDTNKPNYIAVGCTIRHLTEEGYQGTEIHEIAQKHQGEKVKNSHFYDFLMDNDTILGLKEKLLLMEERYKEPIQEEAWPEERLHVPPALYEPNRPLWTDETIGRLLAHGIIR